MTPQFLTRDETEFLDKGRDGVSQQGMRQSLSPRDETDFLNKGRDRVSQQGMRQTFLTRGEMEFCSPCPRSCRERAIIAQHEAQRNAGDDAQ